MQLAHGCAVLRFNVSNGGEKAVRVTRVEMLATSGKTGVNTRAAITAANAESGTLTYSEPQNIAVAVQDATDATKGHLLAAKNGENIESLAVYAHCFPTTIEDGQFQFLVTVTDDKGEKEKTYITKEEFKVSGITTTDDANTAQKMFKAGYYYTFQLDIAGSRFEELQDYVEVKDEGDNVTGYIVNTYAGLQAWRAAVMNEDGTMKDEDLNLTLGMDITLPAVGEGESNWTPVGDFESPYLGSIDGGGHTLSGLVTQAGEGIEAGFIGCMGTFDDPTKIENLTLANVSVTGPNAGALVGQANHTTISGCKVTGNSSVSALYCAGGLVGYAVGVEISGCENHAAVTATHDSQGYAGGIVGVAKEGVTINNCINYAASITGQYAGYLAGYADYMTWDNFNNSGNENQSGNSDLEEYGFLDEM